MDGLEMGHVAIGRLAWTKSAIGVKDKFMGAVAIRKKVNYGFVIQKRIER